MFRVAAVAIIVTCLGLAGASAQDVKVSGKFSPDSVKIGEVFPYSLTVHYPSPLNVILPDTTWNYKPFELEKKVYFPTVTKNNVSYDSVVYYLSTYEIDSLQTLKLPAFVISGNDSTTVESNTDSIVLKQLVRAKLDSVKAEQLPLKVNTDYFNVSWLLNYPLLLIIGAVMLIAIAVVWIIFGKRIRRYYQLRKLTRNHEAFLQQFTTSVQQLENNFSQPGAENIFVLWKNYMEKLVGRPFTKYTSREIVLMEKDEVLATALQALNRIIYAGMKPSSEDPFALLRGYTNDQFAKKPAS